MNSRHRPRIGITADFVSDDQGRSRHQVRSTYIEAVMAAGGIPLILPADETIHHDLGHTVDGVLIIGGDDIDTRPFGIPLHPLAKVMQPARQQAEFSLLRALDQEPKIPVLGICLGMQLMGVHRGATLIQHLGDEIKHAERHQHDAVHQVTTEIGSGPVTSWHHQALADSGSLQVIGRADDGVIEAVCDPDRPFYVGVQWHPERTADRALGVGIVRMLVEAAAER